MVQFRIRKNVADAVLYGKIWTSRLEFLEKNTKNCLENKKFHSSTIFFSSNAWQNFHYAASSCFDLFTHGVKHAYKKSKEKR